MTVTHKVGTSLRSAMALNGTLSANVIQRATVVRMALHPRRRVQLTLVGYTDGTRPQVP